MIKVDFELLFVIFSLPRYKNTKEIKGFAFIEYNTAEAAEKACQVIIVLKKHFFYGQGETLQGSAALQISLLPNTVKTHSNEPTFFKLRKVLVPIERLAFNEPGVLI